MERQRVISYIAVLVILVAAMGICALTTQGRRDTALPVKMSLPEQLVGFEGIGVLFCQNEQCMRSHLSTDLADATTCPECGAALDPVSVAEKTLLPSDTVILHRVYRGARGQQFSVSVVLGGAERRSIHKPQVCLVAQGHRINKQRSISVAVDHDQALDVALLELDASRGVFAYWFTNGAVETASHLERLFWTAWDGVIHNRRRRWAYISIYSSTIGGRAPKAELSAFIGQLYGSTAREEKMP
jgi:EpsI family protein